MKGFAAFAHRTNPRPGVPSYRRDPWKDAKPGDRMYWRWNERYYTQTGLGDGPRMAKSVFEFCRYDETGEICGYFDGNTREARGGFRLFPGLIDLGFVENL